MADMTAFERQVGDEILRIVGPARTVDDLAVAEVVIATSRQQARGLTTVSALSFVVASVIVALFGGFMIAGILTAPQRDEMVPAAATSSPAPTVYRFTDPGGDATGDGPDILAVSATKRADELDLDVELADRWDLARMTVVGSFFADPTSMNISGQERSLPRPDYCNPWFMDSYSLSIGGSLLSGRPGVSLANPGEPLANPDAVHDVPYDLDGSHLRLRLPLAWLGHPQTMSFFLMTLPSDADSAGEPVDMVPDGVGSNADGCLYLILEGEPPQQVEYHFEGFFSPVDDPDINVARAGSAIPVRFSLGGEEGFGILEQDHPKVTPISCDSREPLDPAGKASSAERLDWTYSEWAGRYTWVWQTDEDWAGSCFHFDLGLKGSPEPGFDVRFE